MAGDKSGSAKPLVPGRFRDEDISETAVSGETAWEGSFFKVARDTVRLPNGHEAIREYIRHPGAVGIIAMTDDGEVIMERQFRWPIQGVVSEIPAGKIDPGEDPLETAKRELKEETGYTAKEWSFLGKIHNALGYSDEALWFYLARGLEKGKAEADDDEFLQVYTIGAQTLIDEVDAGLHTDFKTVLAAFWLGKIVCGQFDPKK